MKLNFRMKRLRHLSSTLGRRNAVKEKKEVASNTATVSPANLSVKDSQLESEVELSKVTALAVKHHNRVFHRFNDLPTEIRLKIWKVIADSIIQVVHIVLHTSGTTQRKFKYHGLYRSLTPIPPFLQVSHETREEGLKFYDTLHGGGDFLNRIPFNFKRDILYISLGLAHSRWMLQSLRNMLPLITWRKLQNVTFQVSAWDCYPLHLELIEELPMLKQLHFTSWRASEYRQNVQQVVKSDTVKWAFSNCAEMLGYDIYGQVDFEGVDDIDDMNQLPFHFHPLKLEFEYVREHQLETLSIELSSWGPKDRWLGNTVHTAIAVSREAEEGTEAVLDVTDGNVIQDNDNPSDTPESFTSPATAMAENNMLPTGGIPDDTT